MRNQVAICLLICFSITGNSCSDKSYELRGQVQDDQTQASIPGRRILVQALTAEENGLFPVYIDEFSTDAEGKFSYRLKRDSRYYLYNLSFVGDSAYAYKNVQLGLTELTRYGKFLTFELRRLTDLTIRLESRRQIDMEESVYVSWFTDGTEGKYLYPYTVSNHGSVPATQQLKWTGGKVRSEIHTKVFAGKATVIHWEIFRYGKYRKISDTIMCARDAENQVTLTF